MRPSCPRLWHSIAVAEKLEDAAARLWNLARLIRNGGQAPPQEPEFSNIDVIDGVAFVVVDG